MTKTTPCTEKGYRVGDRFRVTNREAVFDLGSIVELYEDDGSASPKFKLITGGCQYDGCRDADGNSIPGAYECLQYVTKIEEAPVTKAIIAAPGADITADRIYPIYTRGGVEYFKDDAGDERLVRVQLRRGARYGSATPRDTARHGFRPGDRVECTKHHAFQGGVHRGCRGTVVEPRDPGVNVKWDNGFSVKAGTATINPEDVSKVTENEAPWDTAPAWATHYGIEPSGHRYWFNLPPVELNKYEFRRGLDNRPGNKHAQLYPSIADHNGKFYVEARPVTKPEVTPQSEAKYLIRILKCDNNLIHGSFVEGYRAGANGFTGSTSKKDNRTGAKRFTYEEVTEFLRNRAERNEGEDFEVVLDFIKTGATKPDPKRGNNGWTVGTKLRCDLSGHPELHPRETYIVVGIDGDGDEIVRGECDIVLAKYGRSERNEYTVISEGK